MKDDCLFMAGFLSVFLFQFLVSCVLRLESGKPVLHLFINSQDSLFHIIAKDAENTIGETKKIRKILVTQLLHAIVPT